MACPVVFLQEEEKLTWKCPTHMGYQSSKPMSRKTCWKYNCPGRLELDKKLLCSYELCSLLKREGSKYCSDTCRKRKARRDYKKRQKKVNK